MEQKQKLKCQQAVEANLDKSPDVMILADHRSHATGALSK